MSNKYEERHLFLPYEIENGNLQNIIETIYLINEHDEKQEKQIVDYKRNPIYLHCNSYGGSIYDGFALISTIKNSKTPIYTISEGYTMSIGLEIFVSGHKRYASPYTTFMFHDVTICLHDKMSFVQEKMKHQHALRDLLIHHMLKHTQMTPELIHDILEKKIDYYFDAEEAKKLKVVDEIYTNE